MLAQTAGRDADAEVVRQLCGVVEVAPAKFLRDPGTHVLRLLANAVPQSVPYFWFLFNEAPAHDKFRWAVTHASDEQLVQAGGYEGLSSDLIPFD